MDELSSFQSYIKNEDDYLSVLVIKKSFALQLREDFCFPKSTTNSISNDIHIIYVLYLKKKILLFLIVTIMYELHHQ